MRNKVKVHVFCWIAVALAVTPILRAQSERVSLPNGGQNTLDTIVSNMEQAQLRNKESFRPYTVTRAYKLFDGEHGAQDPQQKPSSEVIANVNFVPPNHKTFEIESVQGSDRGKSIVQHILENESGASGKGPTALTTESYEFTLLGQDWINGKSCWVLGLNPRHGDKTTIRGRAWVDKNTYLVQQVQGELAKTPSWWLKKVETTVHYGDAEGMWLPIATYSVADVRFFGKHVLTSQSIEMKTADQSAERAEPRTMSPMNSGRRALPAIVGAGIYVRR